MNTTTVVLAGVGAILIYSAIKNKSPIELVKTALGTQQGKSAKTVSDIPNNIAPVSPVTPIQGFTTI
jgi:uncharacterized membrane protein